MLAKNEEPENFMPWMQHNERRVALNATPEMPQDKMPVFCLSVEQVLSRDKSVVGRDKRLIEKGKQLVYTGPYAARGLRILMRNTNGAVVIFTSGRASACRM